jgi:hypothetical protein
MQTMEPRSYVSFRPFLSATLILLVIGWGSVSVAIFALTPTVWARWLLFFGGILGLTGLALPASWFLNLRFPSTPPVNSSILVRQAAWVGVYGALLTWLQQERLVSLLTGLGLAAGLVAIEYLIRMREKARWQPAVNDIPAAQPEPPLDGDPPIQ